MRLVMGYMRVSSARQGAKPTPMGTPGPPTAAVDALVREVLERRMPDQIFPELRMSY